MKELQITAKLSIHSGKLHEFKKIAETCIKSTQEKDTRTLQYDWFFNHDQTVCHVRERYPDSEALLEHLANLGPAFGQLLALGDFSAEVYGNPSEALVKATEGLDLTVYSLFQKI